MHDLHTAVLMREHAVSRICTRDTGVHRRFPPDGIGRSRRPGPPPTSPSRWSAVASLE